MQLLFPILLLIFLLALPFTIVSAADVTSSSDTETSTEAAPPTTASPPLSVPKMGKRESGLPYCVVMKMEDILTQGYTLDTLPSNILIAPEPGKTPNMKRRIPANCKLRGVVDENPLDPKIPPGTLGTTPKYDQSPSPREKHEPK